MLYRVSVRSGSSRSLNVSSQRCSCSCGFCHVSCPACTLRPFFLLGTKHMYRKKRFCLQGVLHVTCDQAARRLSGVSQACQAGLVFIVGAIRLLTRCFGDKSCYWAEGSSQGQLLLLGSLCCARVKVNGRLTVAYERSRMNSLKWRY